MKIYAFGPYRLNADDLQVLLGETDLGLGTKVVETLLALIERAGQTCTKQQLLERVWPEGFIGEASLVQNIYVLRKALGEHWGAPVIETVRRKGYRFVAPLRHDANPQARRASPAFRWSALVLCALVAAGLLRYSSGPAQGTATGLSSQNARLYALGRYYWNSRTRANVLKSVDYFRQILRTEPRSAPAYAGLADAYFILADYEYGPKSPATYRRWERVNAEKALALDPNLSEAHASLGEVYETADHKPVAAAAEFGRALALDPNNAVAHHWLGIALIMQGKTAASRHELEMASALDPTSPAIDMWLGIHEYFARRYDAAISHYRQALDLDPQNGEAPYLIGLAYEQTRKYSAALRIYDRLERLCACAGPLAMEARTYALMGKTSQARVALARAKTNPRKEGLESVSMAAALIALGERVEALSWLRNSRSERKADPWLAMDPRLDAVRNDPRFAAIIGPPNALCTSDC